MRRFKTRLRKALSWFYLSMVVSFHWLIAAIAFILTSSLTITMWALVISSIAIAFFSLAFLRKKPKRREKTEAIHTTFIIFMMVVIGFVFSAGYWAGGVNQIIDDGEYINSIIYGNLERQITYIYVPNRILEKLNQSYQENYPNEMGLCLYGTKELLSKKSKVMQYEIIDVRKPIISNQNETNIKYQPCIDALGFVHSHTRNLNSCNPSTMDLISNDREIDGIICGNYSVPNLIHFYDRYGSIINDRVIFDEGTYYEGNFLVLGDDK